MSTNTMDTATDTTERINMILRQTDYDVPTAEQKLKTNNYNVTQVIRDYLNNGKLNRNDITRCAATPKLSRNQQIYKEIRTFMDDAAKTYHDKKEEQEKKERKE